MLSFEVNSSVFVKEIGNILTCLLILIGHMPDVVMSGVSGNSFVSGLAAHKLSKSADHTFVAYLFQSPIARGAFVDRPVAVEQTAKEMSEEIIRQCWGKTAIGFVALIAKVRQVASHPFRAEIDAAFLTDYRGAVTIFSDLLTVDDRGRGTHQVSNQLKMVVVNAGKIEPHVSFGAMTVGSEESEDVSLGFSVDGRKEELVEQVVTRSSLRVNSDSSLEKCVPNCNSRDACIGCHAGVCFARKVVVNKNLPCFFCQNTPTASGAFFFRSNLDAVPLEYISDRVKAFADPNSNLIDERAGKVVGTNRCFLLRAEDSVCRHFESRCVYNERELYLRLRAHSRLVGGTT